MNREEEMYKNKKNKELRKRLEDTTKKEQKYPSYEKKDMPTRPQTDVKQSLILNIPIKEVKKLESGRHITPLIKSQPVSLKLQLLLGVVQQSTLVIPELIYKQVVTDVKVPTLRSASVRALTTPYPALRLQPVVDVSVRPVTYKKLNMAEKVEIMLKAHFPVFTLPTVTTQVEQVKAKCIPKIQLIELPEEGTVTVIEGLRKAVPDEGDGELEREVFEFEFYRNYISVLGGLANVDRPVCILLPKYFDSYVASVALICRELYRIRVGGKPEPYWSSKGSKREIEECMKAGGMIFVIDDSKSELLPKFDRIKSSTDFSERVENSKLLDRLNELFSQNYGFIIFHVNYMWVDELESFLEREARVPKLVKLEPPYLPRKVRRPLASMCWGFVKIEDKETFDELFYEAERRYYELIESVRKDYELGHWIIHDRSESDEHIALKMVVAEALAREMGARNKLEVVNMLSSGKIEAEKILENEKGRADLYVDERRLYVEIETFYGTGDPISEKLDCKRPDGTLGTLRKYEDIKGAKVMVVLLGLHMLLYIKGLLALKKIYKNHYNLDVDFCTIDIENRRLVSLRDYLKHLKKLDEKIIGEFFEQLV